MAPKFIRMPVNLYGIIHYVYADKNRSSYQLELSDWYTKPTEDTQLFGYSNSPSPKPSRKYVACTAVRLLLPRQICIVLCVAWYSVLCRCQ